MHPVALELLFRRLPILSDAQLSEALSRVFGTVELSWEDGVRILAFPEHPVRVRGKEVPYTLLLREEELERCSADYEEPLSQDWVWPEAEEALQGCEAALVLTDPQGPLLVPAVRVAFLMGVLRVLVQRLEPAAVHGCDALVLVDPEGLPEDPDPLTGLVRVRRFRIDDGDDGELLDTVGLAPFGLPDLEIRAKEGEGGRWAQRLRGLAWELVTEGRLPDSPFPGWRTHPRPASVTPRRGVLRLEGA